MEKPSNPDDRGRQGPNPSRSPCTSPSRSSLAHRLEVTEPVCSARGKWQLALSEKRSPEDHRESSGARIDQLGGKALVHRETGVRHPGCRGITGHFIFEALQRVHPRQPTVHRRRRRVDTNRASCSRFARFLACQACARHPGSFRHCACTCPFASASREQQTGRLAEAMNEGQYTFKYGTPSLEVFTDCRSAVLAFNSSRQKELDTGIATQTFGA